MLTIITPATAAALTTLDAVKRDLDVIGTEEDAALADLIAQASASLCSWIGRPLARETVRETFRLERPEQSLCLSRLPVADIVSVTVGASVLDVAAVECDRGAGLLYRISNAGRYLAWPSEVVKVEYAGGWLLPGDPARDLPADIEAACLALVRRAYHQTGRDPALKGLDVGSLKLDWFIPGGDPMPVDVVPVVDRYRIILVG